MSGFFTAGEKKDRPGIYKRRLNVGIADTGLNRGGIVAAVVTGDWGPLNTASVIDATEDIGKYIGSSTGSGYKTIAEAIKGGVQTLVIVRAGNGGTNASITLKDTNETAADVVTVAAKYPGTFPLSLSVKESLDDITAKTITLYSGTTVIESFTIAAGTSEVDGIVAALAESDYVNATKVAAGTGTLAAVTQAAFTAGTNPTVNNAAYSAAMDVANTELFDVMCLDTVDTDVHATLKAYVDRIFEAGDYPMAVVSEPRSVALDTRISHAAAFDDEKIIYVLNGWADVNGNVYEGYLAAARIAGMVASVASNDSLTHTVVADAVTLIEALTNANIVKGLKNGCLVISRSKAGNIIIEKAINTLQTLTTDIDAGWKKIRRTKTRFEMMNRIDLILDPFVGSVNNDDNGRAAIIAAGQSVLDAMIGEGKILAGASFALDEANPPTSDSAWFVIQADDIDSFETGYLTYRFRFNPEQ